MISALCLFLLASAVAPGVQATTTGHATATVDVLVTDRQGKPLPSAHVVVKGVSERKGVTNSAGRIAFTSMEAGSYTLRVERDRFITFEKDFAVYGQKGSVVAAISPLSSLAAPRARATARPEVVPASSRSGRTR